MRSTFLPPTMVLAVVSAAWVLGRGPSRAAGDDLPLRDEFDAAFTLPWETVRPDPTHLSLKTHPGKLTITTQYGSIHQAQTTAKNLLFINVPENVDDFVVTTCVENFLPQTEWQQAGLLFYDDDDNYLKWVRDFSGQGGWPVLNMFWEIDQKTQGVPCPVEVGKRRFWLCVIKRGNLYQCAASLDGKTFTTYGVIPWGNGRPKRVGLVAKNGPRQGDQEAQFNFFELRRLTGAEQADPAYQVRRALLGTWKAVGRQFDGKPITKNQPTTLVFTPGALAFEEGRKLVMSYTIDPSATPSRIALIARQHGVGRLLNGIYSLEEDRLGLCLNPHTNAPPPESLQSKTGDGLLWMELQRGSP